MFPKLQGRYADAVIVENRSGAGGRIAAEFVKRKSADGTSIYLAPDALMTLFPYVFQSLTYDWKRDFTPVSRVCKFSMALFAGPGLPSSVKTVADLGEWGKANPKSATFGVPAPGTSPHFGGVLFTNLAGGPFTPVHYVGSAPGIVDLLGGHIPVFAGTVGDGIQYVEAGKLRAIAITGRARSPFLPNAPTLTELGYKDAVLEDYFSVYLPAHASPDLVKSLNALVVEISTRPEFSASIGKWGMEPVGSSAADLVSDLQVSNGQWAELVRKSGFKPEI